MNENTCNRIHRDCHKKLLHYTNYTMLYSTTVVQKDTNIHIYSSATHARPLLIIFPLSGQALILPFPSLSVPVLFFSDLMLGTHCLLFTVRHTLLVRLCWLSFARPSLSTAVCLSSFRHRPARYCQVTPPLDNHCCYLAVTLRTTFAASLLAIAVSGLFVPSSPCRRHALSPPPLAACSADHARLELPCAVCLWPRVHD
jgi:hypothetical protein